MRSVAVILPVFNEEWLIGSTFGSVVAFAREHPNWTFRFVDDGSTDGTPAEIEKRLQIDQAPPNIELVRRPANTGKAVVIRESMLAAE
ncbi:MAG: glycosyltransferase, partial [Phycisphaerales bacterium]|nr:glycosyltransferase [Phycisphaerales bacterium]